MICFFRLPKYTGWFGKLPAVGDFAGKGMPQALQETVHGWMSSGMAALVHARPEDWQAAYLVSPVWHFVMGGGLWDKPALTGCIAPSVDKVGRYSPIIVLRTFDRRDIAKVLPPDSRWLYRIDTALRRIIGERIAVDGVHELLAQLMEAEDRRETANILSDLGIGNGSAAADAQKEWFSWRELPALFGERNDRSFWWAEPSSTYSPRRVVHCGTPDENLFCLLMNGSMSSE